MINFLKKINSALLKLSYYFNLKITSFPEEVMVEPSSICNLNCVLCPISKGFINREKKFMDLDSFKKIFFIPRFFIKKINFWNFGEPFLNKELPEMISFVSLTNVKTQVSTNGLIYNKKYILKILKSGLTNLIISLDTYNKKDYVKYRVKGDFDKLIKNTKKIIKLKKSLNSKTKIILQFLITKKNQNDINKIIKFANQFKSDDIIIKTIGIGSSFVDPNKKEKNFIPTNKYNRYNKNLIIENKEVKRCKYIWKKALILSDNTLIPCCRDQKSELKLGNVSKKSLLKEFNNKKYRNLRKNILSYQKRMLMCLRCPDQLTDNYLINTKKS